MHSSSQTKHYHCPIQNWLKRKFRTSYLIQKCALGHESSAESQKAWKNLVCLIPLEGILQMVWFVKVFYKRSGLGKTPKSGATFFKMSQKVSGAQGSQKVSRFCKPVWTLRVCSGYRLWAEMWYQFRCKNCAMGVSCGQTRWPCDQRSFKICNLF